MIVSIIITFISAFYETESTVEKISIKIGNVIQILFLIGLLLSYKTYVDTSKQVVLTQQSLLTEKGWVGVYDKIHDYYKSCPNFCDSLSYSWQVPGYIQNKTHSSSVSTDNYGAILSLSVLIFQSFESVVNYFLYYDTSETLNEWLCSFIIWANSKTLYDIWTTNKFIYDKSTQVFVDKIFASVKETTPRNNTDVINLAEAICKSDEVRNMFKEFNKISPCN